jgi:hypothetical protein
VASTIAVVAHDAGGAEVVSSYLRREGADFVLVAGGPAQRIFARKLQATSASDMEETIRNAEWVLCGTSWQSDLEWRALRYAREVGRPTVAFLDHWVNYRERFARNGEECLSDEIWVGDEDALRIARERFPEVSVRLVKNPYFEDLQAELGALQATTARRPGETVILYVCEPVREHALRQHGDERHWGYFEEDALEYFIQNVRSIAATVTRIVVRPHPSEPGDKYAWVAARSAVPITFSSTATLMEDVVAADIVVGCESMAMVVGLLAGKRVLSAIPPGGRACMLPQPSIEILRDLVK